MSNGTPPESWEELGDSLNKFSERFIKAGWATSVVFNEQEGLDIRWTEIGNQRITFLAALYGQLNADTFNPHDCRALWIIAGLEAEIRGIPYGEIPPKK